MGATLQIPWGFYQLLDRQALASNPASSLLFLHSQPPLLNTILAVLLGLSGATGTTPEFWAAGLFAVNGLLGAGLLAALAWALTRSIGWSLAIVALTLASPATLIFQHQFFYPALLSTTLLTVVWGAHRYLATGRESSLAVLVAGLVVTSNLSSLYHPIWAIGVFLIVAALRSRIVQRIPFCAAPGTGSVRPLILACLVLAAGVLAWPAKNAVVFGQFTASTWTGYNTARSTGMLEGIVRDPAFDATLKREVTDFEARWGVSETTVIASPFKTDGSPNWNHYRMVVLNRTLDGVVRHWWLTHPGLWARIAVAHYALWTRPAWIDSYFEQPDGPERSAYRAWQSAAASLMYADLRPAVEAVWPWLARTARSYVTDRPVPLTVFGLLVFPAVMLASLARHARRFSQRAAPDSATALVMAVLILWVLVVPCLTDGHEGNRMRYAVMPLWGVLALDLATQRIGRAARRKGDHG